MEGMEFDCLFLIIIEGYVSGEIFDCCGWLVWFYCMIWDVDWGCDVVDDVDVLGLCV